MARLFAAMILAALAFNAEAETLSAKIDWQYQNIAPGMHIYELKAGAKAPLWQTATVKDAAQLPVGKEIADGELQIEKGTPRRFVLVYQNTGDQPLYFFATPHHAEPAEYSLGFKFKCLCIDHAYSVGPHETWYRVVELRTSRDMAGKAISLTHMLVGIDKTRMEKFSLQPAEAD